VTLTQPPPGAAIVLLAVVLIAAIYDVRYRRIPNWISVSGVVLGIALNTFLYEGVAGLLFSLKGLGLGFGAYLLLYLLRAMGAGDVKLMAAVGSIVGWSDWCGIFIITAILGGIMSLVLVALRGRIRNTFWNIAFILSEMRKGRPAYLKREELDVRNPTAQGLPHGAVIAVSCVFFLAISAHFAR
jgi:prepilin peptidase CpaA